MMSENSVPEGKQTVDGQGAAVERAEAIDSAGAAEQTAPAEPAEAPAARGNPHLAKAIEDAQLILAFSAEKGKELDEKLTRDIINAGAKPKLSEQEEVAFWRTFRELSAQVAPISAESIEAITREVESNLQFKFWNFLTFLQWWRWGSSTYARRVVRRQQGIALITLIVLIVIQSFATFGSLIVSDIATRKEQLKDVQARMLAMETPESKALDEGEDADGRSGPGDAREKGSRQRPSAYKLLKVEQENLYTYLEADYELLARWNYWPDRLFGVEDIYADDSDDDPGAALQNNMTRPQRTTVFLELLQKYILPLIYGLLGACVFILRDLSAKLKAYTFTKTSRINFHIRQYLGMLGGLAVGWFVTPEQPSGAFMALSPLALAFLAGYSIELLFTAMDTLIGAFAGKRQAGAPAGGE